MKAIIVEDELLAAVHAEAVLESLGVEVIGTAEDSAGALELARRQPQLALVDLNLRDGFTGPDVAAQLARIGIKVVFVTANPAELGPPARLAAPVLEKPLEEQRLAEALSPLIGRAGGAGDCNCT